MDATLFGLRFIDGCDQDNNDDAKDEEEWKLIMLVKELQFFNVDDVKKD